MGSILPPTRVRATDGQSPGRTLDMPMTPFHHPVGVAVAPAQIDGLAVAGGDRLRCGGGRLGARTEWRGVGGW
jgi:hypothetical protein